MEGKGEKQLNGAGLSLDEVNDKVYIVDSANSCVQVLLSFQGSSYLTLHLREELLSRPWRILVTDNHVFVTDDGITGHSSSVRTTASYSTELVVMGMKEGCFIQKDYVWTGMETCL